jgi:hypothetical protein
MSKLVDISKQLLTEKGISPESEKTIKVNESVGQAAFYYEKLRNSLDWQDEHLFLKNAIKRILKRRVYLSIKQDNTARILLHELVWAKYFPNESIPVTYTDEIAAILRKYNYLRKSVVSSKGSSKITEIIVGLAACEIEEFLRPSPAQKNYISFTANHISSNLKLSENEITKEQMDTKVHLAVLRELFKADLDQLRYYLIRNQFPSWPRVSKKDIKYFGENFDKIIDLANGQIFDPQSYKLQRYVKKNIPTFRIIWEIISYSREDGGLLKDEFALESVAHEIIAKRNKNIHSRVLRSVLRGIIFIFLTKIILALIIEYPYELKYLGEVNYMALSINILLPPLVMLVIGAFIKVPGRKNTRVLVGQVVEVVTKDKYIKDEAFTLNKKRSGSYFLFNIFYLISSMAVLTLTVWGLLALNFNVISIALFFFFVSLVSFLSFRISGIAKELEVRKGDDSIIAGIFNFIFLPFVYIGKILSDQWSNYNPTLWFWDFIIEAPFKTIMSLFESWISFVREKREDFE